MFEAQHAVEQVGGEFEQGVRVHGAAIVDSDEQLRLAAQMSHDVAIDRHAPDVVALAGFMRILGPAFVRRFEGRLLNIHPSLLPAFPGLHTHRRALAAGCKVAGATVHLVTSELDHGPIVMQSVVPVHPGDDEQALAARVLATEHVIYPLALRWFVEDRLRIDDGVVSHTGGASQVLV